MVGFFVWKINNTPDLLPELRALTKLNYLPGYHFPKQQEPLLSASV